MLGMAMMSNVYIEFLKKNFPSLNLDNEKILEKIHLKICENNIMSDFFLANILNVYPNAKSEYIKIYKLQMNRILIYIGINDQNVLNFCFRSFIESILKLIYSLQNNYEIEKINKTSFRFLGDSLKDDKKSLYPNMKNDISKLLSYYGQYSNDIHGKNINVQNEIEYMQLILSSNNSINYNKIYTDLNNIIKIYELILITALNLTMESSVVFRLSKILSNDQIKAIFKVV